MKGGTSDAFNQGGSDRRIPAGGECGGRQPSAADDGASASFAGAFDSLGGTGDAGPLSLSLTAEDRVRLVAVARRPDRSGPLDLDLAADLVEAVLPEALAAMAAGPVGRRRLVERIARSLLDDPESRRRLESLLAAVRAAVQRDPGEAKE
jgi:hypothetical protein